MGSVEVVQEMWWECGKHGGSVGGVEEGHGEQEE
jgi:hypothetical protein